MAIPNASQIRFLESELNSKRESMLMQADSVIRCSETLRIIDQLEVRKVRLPMVN